MLFWQQAPSWQCRFADRVSGVEEAVAARVLEASPLHARVGALVQLLRFSGGVDGHALPPLPPVEAALLAAAESDADLQAPAPSLPLSLGPQMGMAVPLPLRLCARGGGRRRSLARREGSRCLIHLTSAAISPHRASPLLLQQVLADTVRLRERHHAGGARIDGVWAVQVRVLLTLHPDLPHLALTHQGMLYAKDGASEQNKEAVAYQKLTSAKDANPMKFDRSTASARQGGGTSLEQKRRGGLAMKAMYAEPTPPC